MSQHEQLDGSAGDRRGVHIGHDHVVGAGVGKLRVGQNQCGVGLAGEGDPVALPLIKQGAGAHRRHGHQRIAHPDIRRGVLRAGKNLQRHAHDQRSHAAGHTAVGIRHHHPVIAGVDGLHVVQRQRGGVGARGGAVADGTVVEAPLIGKGRQTRGGHGEAGGLAGSAREVLWRAGNGRGRGLHPDLEGIRGRQMIGVLHHQRKLVGDDLGAGAGKCSVRSEADAAGQLSARELPHIGGLAAIGLQRGAVGHTSIGRGQQIGREHRHGGGLGGRP